MKAYRTKRNIVDTLAPLKKRQFLVYRVRMAARNKSVGIQAKKDMGGNIGVGGMRYGPLCALFVSV